jgi:hypothetical protein
MGEGIARKAGRRATVALREPSPPISSRRRSGGFRSRSGRWRHRFQPGQVRPSGHGAQSKPSQISAVAGRWTPGGYRNHPRFQTHSLPPANITARSSRWDSVSGGQVDTNCFAACANSVVVSGIFVSLKYGVGASGSRCPALRFVCKRQAIPSARGWLANGSRVSVTCDAGHNFPC